MTFDDDLLKAYERDITAGYEKVRNLDLLISDLKGDRAQRVNELSAYVIEHFDHFVESIINPNLPKRYQIRGAKGATDHTAGFVITTNRIRLPKDETDREKMVNILEENLNSYLEETSWVTYIVRDYVEEEDWNKKRQPIKEHRLRGH